ncbi:MAG: MotA/TolQ/ExbB proton channel family protein [Bdellovibrionota bacterium]
MDFFAKIAQAFQHGGFWMYPIMLVQMSALAIIIERTYSLFFKRKINQTELAQGYEELIRRGNIDAVIEKAKELQNTQPIARAVLAGAKAAKIMGGKDEIQGKMDEVLIHENALIERRIGFLSMLGNVATLTGLLGTITGMIKSFAAVAFANPAEKAALLAAGISEAMNATAYGLIAAIPALVMYAILQNRANQMNEDLNRAALKSFNWLSFSYETIGFKPMRGSDIRESSREVNV